MKYDYKIVYEMFSIDHYYCLYRRPSWLRFFPKSWFWDYISFSDSKKDILEKMRVDNDQETNQDNIEIYLNEEV